MPPMSISYFARGAIPPSPPTDDPDWLLRSGAPGVEVANRLATLAALTSWIVPDSTQDHVSVDTSTKPLGGTGSFKFEIRPTDSTASGSVCIPFSPVSAGSVHWSSARVMHDDTGAYQQWCFNYETAAKISILSRDARGAAPTGSNQPNEVVMSMNYSANAFGVYWQIGGGPTNSPDQPFNGSDFIWQPKIDRGVAPLTGNDPATGSPWTTGVGSKQERARYGGLYSTKSNAEYQQGIGDPISGAVKMQANVWYTITKRVEIAAFGGAGNRITVWIAKDGSPYELIADVKNAVLGAGSPYNGETFLPYVSQRSPGGRQSSLSGISGVSIVGTGGGTAIGAGSLEYVASTGAFRFKAANDSYGTARYISTANNIDKMNLKSSTHGAITTTSASVTLPQSSIALVDASAFPAGGGSIVLGDPDTSNPQASHGNGEQYLEYTGKTGNTLTGCTGGTGLHDAGVLVRIQSYIGVRVDNPALLPSSGTTTATVTVSAGRKPGAMWVADYIKGTQPINAYGGYPPYGVSELADQLADMAAGEWRTFSCATLTNAMLTAGTSSGNPGILNGFGYTLQWDTAHKRAAFAGTSHTGPDDIATAGGFFVWNDVDNTCTREVYNGNAVTSASGIVPLVGHAYDHGTFDKDGNFYFRFYNSRTVRRRLFGATGSGSWIDFSSISGGNYANQVAGALRDFPALNGGAGGLVFLDVGGFQRTAADRTTWSNATGVSASGLGPYQNWLAVTKSFVYGGGGNSSSKMYKMDASGVVSACADTPAEAGTANVGVVLPHPNGADLLFFERAAGGNYYKYNSATNTWSGSLGAHGLTRGNIWAGCSIPEYGGLLFVEFPGSVGTPSFTTLRPN